MADEVLVEYALTQPPDELLPFDPWFAEHPDGRVYGTCVRFDGQVGRALCVPMPQDDRFFERVLALPMPNARLFRAEELPGGLRVIRAEWNEPIVPGIFSPMAVNDRALGPGATCAFTITRREVRHRVLAPSRASTSTLWRDIHVELERWCGFSGTNVRLELLRIAAWDAPTDPAAAEHARLKFQLGAFRPTDRDAMDDLATLSRLGGHAMVA